MKNMKFEVDLKSIGVGLIICAIIFLGIRQQKNIKTIEAINVNQQIIIQALVNAGVLKIQEPTVQTQPIEKVETKQAKSETPEKAPESVPEKK